MKSLVSIFVLLVIVCAVSTQAFAYRGSGYTQDVYGRWERNDNAYKDSDGDGVVNHYDRNNKNSSVW